MGKAEAKSEGFTFLSGTQLATVDDKGRLQLAKKYRQYLGEDQGQEFTLTLSPTGCIEVLPVETWNQIVTEITRSNALNQGRQTYARFVVGGAEANLTFDKAGRFVIPLRLREAAKIDQSSSVVVKGNIDRLEIWSEEEHKRYEQDPLGYNRAQRDVIAQAYREMKEDFA